MTQPPLRKIRTETALAAISNNVDIALPPGQWFVEQHATVVLVFSDAQGSNHAGDLAVVDFLDGLARREIVFVSWG